VRSVRNAIAIAIAVAVVALQVAGLGAIAATGKLATTPETDLVAPPGWEPLILEGRNARRSGEPAKARQLFTQAIEIAKQEEPEGYHHAIALRELGHALVAMERFEEGLETHRRAHALLEARYSAEDMMVVGSLQGMADAHAGLGDPAKALTLIRRVLAIQLAALGDGGIAVMHTRIRLAGMLAEQGEPEEARTLYETAVEYFEARKAQGPALEPLRMALTGLGDVYLALGETQLAGQAITRAAKLDEQAKDPSKVIERVNNALGLINRGEYAPAKDILLEGLIDLRKILPEEHVHVGLVHYNLGIAHGGLGEWSSAAASYDRALRIFDAVHPPDHVDRVRCLEAYHRVLLKLDRLDEAAAIARKLRAARGD
jgi:tetratricopeptide (TPR) repeat protein